MILGFVTSASIALSCPQNIVPMGDRCQVISQNYEPPDNGGPTISDAAGSRFRDDGEGERVDPPGRRPPMTCYPNRCDPQ